MNLPLVKSFLDTSTVKDSGCGRDANPKCWGGQGWLHVVLPQPLGLLRHRNWLCSITLLCQLPAASHSMLLTLACLKFSLWMAVLHLCVG